MTDEPSLVSWLRLCIHNGGSVIVEPTTWALPPGSEQVWRVCIANVDGTEHAHLATCANELDADLVAEALRQLGHTSEEWRSE